MSSTRTTSAESHPPQTRAVENHSVGEGELTDSELVSRCLQAGARYDEAFEALYARYSARVFGFLLKLTRNREAAEDALQETFLRVYKSLEHFDPQRALLTWLLQIARYVAIDAFRVERKVKRLESHKASHSPEAVGRGSLAGDTDQDPVVGPAVAHERAALVEEVMEELSPDDRSLLLLRHWSGLTFRELGDVVDCSSRTAQNRVEAAARRFQRALLERREGDAEPGRNVS
jgi:RNA polymerase sigma-70 factor, ECF subfamily